MEDAHVSLRLLLSLYWVAAIGSVLLRHSSRAFRGATAYGRLDAHPHLMDRWMPRVRKATAFRGFYTCGIAVSVVAICYMRIPSLAGGLFAVHLARRWVETVWLQSMSGSTTLFAAFCGASFYVAVPLSVCLAASSDAVPPAVTVIGCACFAIGWAGQAWCHRALEAAKRANRGKHRVMSAPPFTLVAAPHYTCEVLVYTALAALTGDANVFLIAAFSAVNLRLTAAEAREWATQAGLPPVSKWDLIPGVC
jgi:protein-S-isoprenylcysteine O-methyltransferase Ste14